MKTGTPLGRRGSRRSVIHRLAIAWQAAHDRSIISRRWEEVEITGRSSDAAQALKKQSHGRLLASKIHSFAEPRPLLSPGSAPIFRCMASLGHQPSQRLRRL
jgi:hypothetical protein